MPDNGQAVRDRITGIANPLILEGRTPFEVRASVWSATGIKIGPGGHSDPCSAEVCPYCGACGQGVSSGQGRGGGHGGLCPNG